VLVGRDFAVLNGHENIRDALGQDQRPAAKKQHRDDLKHSKHDHDHDDHKHAHNHNSSTKDASKIPVTIITGFLGAGKTTLINYVLTERHGMRIAVVENEFGAVSIDNKLGIAEKLESKEHLIMLDNGCACCQVRGDLLNTFVELGKLPVPFEAVIIELSGMADPAPVAFTFTSTELSSKFRIDSIVCVVDTKNISQHLRDDSRSKDDVNEAVQQIAFADRVLLNKIDLVSDVEKLAVIDEIRSINSFARTIECQQSSVPLKQILGVSSFSVDQATMLEEEFDYVEKEVYDAAPEDLFQAAAAAAAAGHSADDATKQGARMEKTLVRKDGKSHKFGGVTSVAIKLPNSSFHSARFQRFMATWIPAHGEDLYRSKGICSLHGYDAKFIMQGVHDMVQCSPSDTKWQDSEARGSTVVFIGRNIDKGLLQEELEKCCMREGEAELEQRIQATGVDLRFQVGDRVFCNTGEKEWTPGAVIKQFYHESDWPDDQVVPYQVRLDTGNLIFVPMDDPRVVRSPELQAAEVKKAAVGNKGKAKGKTR
jgi:G3E family GTPase